MTRQKLGDVRWRVHLDGYPDVTTDDLTLDDIETAERVCGVPWVLINPLASAKEAKAMLVLLLIKAGATEDDALKAARKTPLVQLAKAFTVEVPDREQPATVVHGSGEAAPPRLAPTSAAG